MPRRKPLYLCKEFDEYFTVRAADLKEAQGHAEGYGGVAIRRLTKKETETGKIEVSS